MTGIHLVELERSDLARNVLSFGPVITMEPLLRDLPPPQDILRDSEPAYNP